MRRFFFLAPFLLLGCGDSKPPPKPQCDYPQNFKTQHAWLVLEVNGRPRIMASGFLVNRDEGIFITARHFTEWLRNLFGEMKVFWNCKVYDADIRQLPPIEDAAAIVLRKPFDPSDFPPALPIAAIGAQLGDTVYAVGFHPHPYLNDSLGYGSGRSMEIFRNYYGRIMLDSTKLSEIVFDSLPGRIIDLNGRGLVHSRGNQGLFAQIQDSVARYIEVRITTHFNLSFAGLSGGALLNKQGEVLGVITAEEVRPEYDPRGRVRLPQGIFTVYAPREVRDKISVTPISAIRDLLRGVLPH